LAFGYHAFHDMLFSSPSESPKLSTFNCFSAPSVSLRFHSFFFSRRDSAGRQPQTAAASRVPAGKKSVPAAAIKVPYSTLYQQTGNWLEERKRGKVALPPHTSHL
jgi:hypothetical protein